MYVENRPKSPIFTPPMYLTPPLMGFPWNFVSAQGSQKTRMMGHSDGRKSFPIGLAVLIQYRSVTATQPASHVAVAITLNAKASSLKRYKKVHAGHNCSANQNLQPLTHFLLSIYIVCYHGWADPEIFSPRIWTKDPRARPSAVVRCNGSALSPRFQQNSADLRPQADESAARTSLLVTYITQPK